MAERPTPNSSGTGGLWVATVQTVAGPNGTATPPIKNRFAQAEQTVGLRPDDFPAIAAVLPNELPRVTMIVLHKWDMTRRFIDSREHQFQTSRVEDHLSFTFENNIVCWQTVPALQGPWDTLQFESRNNCWWNAAGAPVTFSGKTLEAWQKFGHETGSVVADPLFVDAKHHDYSLKPASPALALGFRPYDWSQAGVYGDAAWISKAHASR